MESMSILELMKTYKLHDVKISGFNRIKATIKVPFTETIKGVQKKMVRIKHISMDYNKYLENLRIIEEEEGDKGEDKYFVSVDYNYKITYFKDKGQEYVYEKYNKVLQFTTNTLKNLREQARVEIQHEMDARSCILSKTHMLYEFLYINDIQHIKMTTIKKNAKKYDIKKIKMKAASFIPFENIKYNIYPNDGKCTIHSLKNLPKMPKIVYNDTKLIQYFQDIEDRKAFDVGNVMDCDDNYEPDIITLESGISAEMLHEFCQKYDITHYALDIDKQIIFKNISKTRHYSILCYIVHDNHMYHITDKAFINKLSQARHNENQKYIISMLQNENTQKIEGDIFDDIPVDQLQNYNNCTIIYQKNNLADMLCDIYNTYNILPQHSSVNNHITKITINKWKLNLLVDPNFNLKHHYKDNDNTVKLTYKQVLELCNTYKIDFTNQSLSSFILQYFNIKNKKTIKRAFFTKKIREEIKQSQNGLCNICKQQLEKKFHVDHIIPVCLNGDNSIENLQCLCIQCHLNKTREENENGVYYNLPDYCSTFNNYSLNCVIKTSLFNRYAFIERLDSIPKKHKLFHLDMSKCRRNILLHLKENNIKFPVFTTLDVPQPFNQDDDIKEGFYFIKSQNYLPFRNNGWYSHPLIKYALDNNIITKNNIKYKLCSSLSLEGDFFNDVINDFMKMPYGMEKAGTNFLVGLMKKEDVNVDRIKYFNMFEAASKYLVNHHSLSTFNGQIHMSKQKFNEDEELYKITSTENIKFDLYTNIIYHMVLDIEAMELHKLTNIIKEQKGHCVAVNTDSVEFWTNGDREINIQDYYWDNNKTILKYHYEDDKEPQYAQRKKKFVHTETFKPLHFEWTTFHDPKTNDFEQTVNCIIQSNKSWNINGIAGSGKTFFLKKLIQTFDIKNIKYKILAPTNKACRQLDDDCITIHKFFASCINNKSTIKKIVQDLQYMIIDEISMVKEAFYALFISIKRINPHIKFIISGDWRQLPPVKDRSDNFDYQNSHVLYELCDGNKLELTECRRSDKELFNLSMEVFNNPDVDISKYKLGKKECDISICYTNNKRIHINTEKMRKYKPKISMKCSKDINDENSQDIYLYNGLPLIAKKTDKQYDVFNSEIFKILKINKVKKVVTIIDPDNDTITKDIKIDDITKIFYPAYCMTVHRLQGSTINNDMTIYEWHLMDNKMKYTAVTRSTSIKFINIV